MQDVIVNMIIEKDYLFRYPENIKTEYIPGYGLISEELKQTIGL